MGNLALFTKSSQKLSKMQWQNQISISVDFVFENIDLSQDFTKVGTVISVCPLSCHQVTDFLVGPGG